PELGVLEPGSPRALDEAHVTVLALDRRFVAAGAENEHLGIGRNRWRRRAARQRDLGLSIADAILLDGRHGRVGRGLLFLRMSQVDGGEKEKGRQQCGVLHGRTFLQAGRGFTYRSVCCRMYKVRGMKRTRNLAATRKQILTAAF